MRLKTLILVAYSGVFLSVNGCGQLQPGREKTINFTVTDFKLPAVMVYYEDPAARTKVPTISTSKSEAEAFVRMLIKQSIEDVLYQQGRSAFLPDSVIFSILQQLDVQITYEPLKCENIVTEPSNPANGAVQDKLNCIIVDKTVTNTCTYTAAGANDCMVAMMFKNFKPIEPKYLSVLGILKTSNAVMANWSNQMWGTILSRVLRIITSSPNGSFLFGASIKLA